MDNTVFCIIIIFSKGAGTNITPGFQSSRLLASTLKSVAVHNTSYILLFPSSRMIPI